MNPPSKGMASLSCPVLKKMISDKEEEINEFKKSVARHENECSQRGRLKRENMDKACLVLLESFDKISAKKSDDLNNLKITALRLKC